MLDVRTILSPLRPFSTLSSPHIIGTNMELKEASSKERFLDFSELTLLRHFLKRTYYEYYLSVPHLKQLLMNNCSYSKLY